jgi:hypothetical protein
MEPIITTYRGVEIRYYEHGDSWKFELRGKEHEYATPRLCREFIDRKPPKNKNPFIRQEAWKNRSFLQGVVPCEVTSVCEPDRNGIIEVWVSDANGKSKQLPSSLYANTVENNIIVNKIFEKTESIIAIGNEIETLKSELVKFQLPDNLE